MQRAPALPAAAPAPELRDEASRLLGLLAGHVATRTVQLGLAHGVIEALARHPDGTTVSDLAAETRLDPYFLATWSRAAFAAQLIDGDESGYWLAPHIATLLLDDSSPAVVGPTFAVLGQPEIFDRFSAEFATGTRMWWNDTSPDFIRAVARTGHPFYVRLIPGGLSRIPGLDARLAGDARILDTACGSGLGLIRLATNYPNASVVGIDGDPLSIERARDAVETAGLGGRIEVVLEPLEDLEHSDEFDLVINNISMHECRDIERVSANVARSLRPGGVFAISDFSFPGSSSELRSVPGLVMSGVQYFEAQIDDQLVPVQAYLDLLARHGFQNVGSFQLTPVHAVTYGQR
jgi:SAM-dependent methyltransferase